MYYLYEGHTGYYYTTNYELEEHEIYCDCFWDRDELVGTFSTEQQLYNLLQNITYHEYILPVIEEWRKTKQ